LGAQRISVSERAALVSTAIAVIATTKTWPGSLKRPGRFVPIRVNGGDRRFRARARSLPSG
jgi:hypothetical protein